MTVAETQTAVRTFEVDPSHSTVEFAVTYSMNSIIKGRFSEFSGSIELDASDPRNSRVTAQVQSASVFSAMEARDNHLKTEEFLNADEHRLMRFESANVTVVEDNHWQVQGDLEILGSTNPVVFDTRFYGITKDAFGATRAGFVAEADINRSDWGLDWNQPLEDGGVLVSDTVRITLYISAKPEDSE